MPEHTISENLARLQAATAAIGAAITQKGGTVNAGDALEEYPADILTVIVEPVFKYISITQTDILEK